MQSPSKGGGDYWCSLMERAKAYPEWHKSTKHYPVIQLHFLKRELGVKVVPSMLASFKMAS